MASPDLIWFKSSGGYDVNTLIDDAVSYQQEVLSQVSTVKAGDPASLLKVTVNMQFAEMTMNSITSISKAITDLFDRMLQKI